MSEPIWCAIRFRIPESWGDDNPLIQGLSEALINGDHDLRDGVWTVAGEGNYGLYDDEVEFWLDWMRTHRVPFLASSDPKYEFDGESIVFNGLREWRGTSGAEQALLSQSEYEAIVAGRSEFTSVEEFFAIMNASTPAHLLAHLPDNFPEEDQ
jgi:hypothetical protein